MYIIPYENRSDAFPHTLKRNAQRREDEDMPPRRRKKPTAHGGGRRRLQRASLSTETPPSLETSPPNDRFLLAFGKRTVNPSARLILSRG